MSKAQEDVLVYTDQKTIANIIESFDFQNVSVLYNENQPKQMSKIKTLLRILYALLCDRYKMLRRLKNAHPSKVYFFHDCFGTMELWLAAKLAKSATVYYSPTLTHKKESELPIRYTFTYLYEKICWGIDRVPLDYGEIRYTLTDKFIQKNHIQKVTVQIELSDLVQKKLNFDSTVKIVLLIDDVFTNPTVDPKAYFSFINEMLNKIGRENVALKNHPRFPFELQNYISGEFKAIPSNIPINLILNEFDVVIGNWSSVLFEAQQYNNVCAISLLEILKPYYPSNLYEGHLRYLTDNDATGYIVYPKTVDELCQKIGGRL